MPSEMSGIVTLPHGSRGWGGAEDLGGGSLPTEHQRFAKPLKSVQLDGGRLERLGAGN